jgi:conjugal transfer mating pair stabilization protein TraN
VAELAALAAAGKDVAALNGVDVRAFTGKAKYCKKFAAGFSNCCKDSGWGQDVGLARCSSDEKALAKAKKDKLTVSVGNSALKRCWVFAWRKKKLLPVRLKTGADCSATGPEWPAAYRFWWRQQSDCRGITVDELQRINFDSLDFTNFMEDLMKNQKIPDNDALTNKTKERIKEIMSQQSSK